MSEYYAVQRSTDHLAHYGVKGMKWGVRKAIASGNEKALDRHFRKAAKKLAKLQDIGFNSKKYAAKATAYGAAAAGTATIALPGTKGISKFFSNKAKKYQDLSDSITNGYNYLGPEVAASYKKRAEKATDLSKKIDEWGEKQSSIFTPRNKIVHKPDGSYGFERTKGLKKGEVLRIGAGLATAGFGAKAVQNAYRASHSSKYRTKAYEFKNAMDDAFSGTKYSRQYVAPPRKSKKKRR